MNGLSVLMIIFAICIFLTGLYMFTGHKLGIMWQATFKDLTINECKNIGKWTMICSLIPLIIAVLGVLFNI